MGFLETFRSGPPVLRGVDVTITSSQTGGLTAANFLLLRRSRFVVCRACSVAWR